MFKYVKILDAVETRLIFRQINTVTTIGVREGVLLGGG